MLHNNITTKAGIEETPNKGNNAINSWIFKGIIDNDSSIPPVLPIPAAFIAQSGIEKRELVPYYAKRYNGWAWYDIYNRLMEDREVIDVAYSKLKELYEENRNNKVNREIAVHLIKYEDGKHEFKVSTPQEGNNNYLEIDVGEAVNKIIEIRETEKTKNKDIQAIFFHNHPKGTPPSDTDLDIFLRGPWEAMYLDTSDWHVCRKIKEIPEDKIEEIIVSMNNCLEYAFNANYKSANECAEYKAKYDCEEFQKKITKIWEMSIRQFSYKWENEYVDYYCFPKDEITENDIFAERVKEALCKKTIPFVNCGIHLKKDIAQRYTLAASKPIPEVLMRHFKIQEKGFEGEYLYEGDPNWSVILSRILDSRSA